MTDRGRIYIILGAPRSIEQIAGSADLYPTELWSYFGDVSKGLLTHFVLTFYQRGNTGEYKLYDPFIDGPARLLINAAREFDISDYQSMYDRIYELQPDLAMVTLSIIPGQSLTASSRPWKPRPRWPTSTTPPSGPSTTATPPISWPTRASSAPSI